MFYVEKIKRLQFVYEKTTEYIPFAKKEDLVVIINKCVLDRLKKYLEDEIKFESELVKEYKGIKIIEIDYTIPKDIVIMPRKYAEKLLQVKENTDDTKE